MAPRQPLDWFAIDAVIVGRRRALFLAALTTALLYGQWSYSIPSLRRLAPQILKSLKSVVAVALIVAGLAYMFDQRIVSPAQISGWMALSAILLCSVRYAAMRVIDRLTLAGRLVRRTVIVGGGKDANDLIRELRADPANHMQILGVFDDRQDERVGMSKTGIAQLGTFEKLAGFCSDMGVDLLIVTVPVRAEERLMQILEKLFTLQADIRVQL